MVRDTSAEVLRWLCPWHQFEYPGHRLACLNLLGGVVTWRAVLRWRDRRRTPLWALERLQAALEARVTLGRELLQRINDEIAIERAKPPLRKGFMKNRPFRNAAPGNTTTP